MSQLTNEQLLADDPDSQSIESEERPAVYDPEPDAESGVVVVEPEIITIGRKMRRDALRREQM